jgi:HK97 gp10 family phage protein
VDREGDNIVGTVFSTAHYAPYQEWGTGLFAVKGDGRKTGWAYEDPKTGETVFTRGNRPHPFLGPALRENKDVILEFLQEGLIND